MSIRLKIVLIVLPLVITTLLLTGASSFFSATNAITGIATDFLGFKAAEFQKYAESQWLLLVENNMTERPSMVAATQAAIQSYAESIVRSETEVIFALDGELNLAMQTGELALLEEERPDWREIVESRPRELITPRISGSDRVAKGFYFEPFDWYIVVSEQRDTFYSPINQITQRTGIILIAAIILGVVMVLVFAGYLTNPLTRVVQAMEKIISTNDMSARVEVEYNDETGKLAHTFNIMVDALEEAQKQIKRFAFDAVVARKKELNIRNIFQRYVPPHVIDGFFANPGKNLTPEYRTIPILFTDIRDFSTISEGMDPEQLVYVLNRYFTTLVDIITARDGIVDKYIGDAIMAFFGAPVRRQDDANRAVRAALEMQDALDEFNKDLTAQGRKPFRTGIGINYGVVLVGNIGHEEKKVDYTIIGESVNLASRLEGLTKEYREPLIISKSVQMKVEEEVACRLLGKVAVKGMTRPVEIYAPKRQGSLTQEQNQVLTLHNAGMEHYFGREFDKAAVRFQEVQNIVPQDFLAGRMIARCQEYKANPPPADWNGVEVMTKK